MSEEQEPFETMMQKICASVLRDMQPQVVEAAQARAALQLRDRFAMAALTGLLAKGTVSHLHYEECQYHADSIADAMMKARGDV